MKTRTKVKARITITIGGVPFVIERRTIRQARKVAAYVRRTYHWQASQ